MPTLPRLHHQRGCGCPSCYEWREHDAAKVAKPEPKAAPPKARPVSHDEQAAIDAMYAAWSKLKALGWREGVYMPKDGTAVTVCEAGSTGTFDCRYSGEWPDGYFNTYDGGEVYPSRSAPVLFKPKTVTWGRR